MKDMKLSNSLASWLTLVMDSLKLPRRLVISIKLIMGLWYTTRREMLLD